MGTQFAIIRVAKVKSLAGLNGRSKHNLREGKAPAHSDATKKNIWITGPQTSKGMIDLWKNITEGMTVRKNAVLALEYVLTASPEFFKTQAAPTKKAWVEESLAFIQKKHGAKNILQSVLHLDEKTPHLHVVVVPVHKNKLNARQFINGRKVLKELQSAYAAAVAKFGLHRGIDGSNIKNVSPRDYRKALSLALKPLPELSLADYAAAAIGHKTKAFKEHAEIIRAQQITSAGKANEKKLAEAAAAAKDEADKLKRRLERIEGDLETERQTSEKLRRNLSYADDEIKEVKQYAEGLAEEVKRLKPSKTGQKVIPLFKD